MFWAGEKRALNFIFRKGIYCDIIVIFHLNKILTRRYCAVNILEDLDFASFFFFFFCLFLLWWCRIHLTSNLVQLHKLRLLQHSFDKFCSFPYSSIFSFVHIIDKTGLLISTRVPSTKPRKSSSDFIDPLSQWMCEDIIHCSSHHSLHLDNSSTSLEYKKVKKLQHFVGIRSTWKWDHVSSVNGEFFFSFFISRA